MYIKRKKLKRVVCKFCYRAFTPASVSEKWCSKDCKQRKDNDGRREANIKKLQSIKPRSCKGCNKTFTPTRRCNDEQQVFCPGNCKVEYHKVCFRRERTAKRALVTKTCPICDKEFSPRKRITQKYCSKRCCYLIPKKCYKALQTCLKYMGQDKTERTHKLLGFTPDELQKHVKSHPNWDAIKEEDWNLDHIFPIIAFIDHGITDVSLICCLENLRPMTGHGNRKKNRTYDKKEFVEWLEEQNET